MLLKLYIQRNTDYNVLMYIILHYGWHSDAKYPIAIAKIKMFKMNIIVSNVQVQ